MRLVPLAPLVLLITSVCYGLDPERLVTQYSISAWTQKDGLPTTQVWDLTQSQDGYLWLASSSGLFRFDGARFVHWEPVEGPPIPSGIVYAVCPARDGSIWFGMVNGSVGQVKDGRVRMYGLAEGLSPTLVHDIVEGKDGSIWVASFGGLSRFRNGRWTQPGPAEGIPERLAYSVYVDSAGVVWMSSAQGVFFQREGQERFQRLNAPVGDGVFAEWPKGSPILISLQSGEVRRVDAARGSASAPLALRFPTIWRARLERNGNLWVGTVGQGLFRVRDRERPSLPLLEQMTKREGLPNESVWSVMEDREGNIWAATSNGLTRIRNNKVVPISDREGLASDTATATIAAPDGTIWVGTHLGISRIRGPHSETIAKGEGFGPLYRDQSGTVWAASRKHLWRYEQGRATPLNVTGLSSLKRIVLITQDPAGSLLLFDQARGPHVLRANSIESLRSNALLSHSIASAAARDKDGRTWIGFLDGSVAMLSTSGARLYWRKDGLPEGSISSITVDSRGFIHITGEHGVSRLIGDRFVHLSYPQQVSNDFVSWILDDGRGDYWLGLSVGAMRVNAEEFDRAFKEPGYSFPYRLYDSADGIRGTPNRISSPPAARAADGSVWFTTSDGIAVIDPTQLHDNPVPPPVRIEEFTVNGMTVYHQPGIQFPPRVNNLNIRFTALSLSVPERVKLRYKLEGFDRDWSPPGIRREAFYTNLPPRNYVFRVIAANQDGVWNEEGASIAFTVLPSFEETLWFWTLCAMLIALAIWLMYRWRLRQMSLHMAEIFEATTAERIRIAQELHDTLLQGLSGVVMHLDVIDRQLPDQPDRAKQAIQRVLELADRAAQEGRQTLTDMRTSAEQDADLAAALAQPWEPPHPLAANPKISVIVEGHQRTLNPLGQDQTYRIGREAVLNAIRHANATHVEITLRYETKGLTLLVRDNGQGMTEEVAASGRPGHFGLRGMRERAEKLGADLTIRSRLGSGTEVSVSFPASAVYRDGAPEPGGHFIRLLRRLGIRSRRGGPGDPPPKAQAHSSGKGSA